MMKKLFSLLLSVSFANIAYAQTCTQTPSCEDLGYTMSSDDCKNGEGLKCPFDETKMYCPSSQDDEDGGDSGSITLLIKSLSASASLDVYFCGGILNVDCGNGTTQKVLVPDCEELTNNSSSKDPAVICKYTSKGEYTLKITGWGSFISLDYSTSYIKINEIKSLDIRNVGTINNICDKSTTGSIPNLPPDLTCTFPNKMDYKYSCQLFNGCKSLTGSIPPLPKNLVNGEYMFYNCSGLTGSIPELPKSLVTTYNMFYKCSGLTGDVPAIPDEVQDARYMFQGCSGLNGSIIKLPDNLVDGGSMFSECINLTGNIPKLPDSLIKADAMFYQCESLDGIISNIPANLENGRSMFRGCTGLTGGIPELPDSLYDGDSMFYGCRNLTGGISKLPANLTSANYMFTQCFNLEGPAPARPTSLSCPMYIFRATQITKTPEWDDGVCDAW